jgi:predicted alpha/beta-hydrolase family hydrolase
VSALELPTPHGPARAHVHPAQDARAALVLGHGAGGGVTARDLVAAEQAALSERVSVALVEQPYRVAGRRSPAPAHQLDAAWTAVVEQLLAGKLGGLPLIAGGRSSGARVACRTAAATGAIGVLCLAFPLHPPGRPEKTRQPELDAVEVPVLVVQGASDPFGMPAGGPRRTIARLRGNHSLGSDVEGLRSAVRAWLPGVLG